MRLHPDHHDPEHATTETRNCLEKIGVNMVSQIPLDGMHLCDEGVGGTILTSIVKKSIYGGIKNQRELLRLNQLYIGYAKHTPSEFQRKPRSLLVHGNWKATEFRMFLLYLGPVWMKKLLNGPAYEHFLKFSVAYRLLNQNVDPTNLETARILLKEFVENFTTYYAEEFLGYNIHNLLHLVDECERHGCVNDFSAYKYENAIMGIRKMKRSSYMILKQLGNCSMRNVYFSRIENKPRNNNFCIDSIKNSCFITSSNSIVKVMHVDSGASEVEVSIFRKHTDLFTSPLPSSDLDIHVVWDLSVATTLMPVSSLMLKCVLLPHDEGEVNKSVCLPLHHVDGGRSVLHP